ncbi:MAG: hypothetical protein KAJ37_09825 [Candidatus Krumholzibacteria bacterium]|nr:hypothetical protein [Candidatus Krumholzibacteria bacterium]
MKYSPSSNALKRTTHLVVDALTGRLGVVAMVLAYSTCAVVLLAYVSTHVYTYSLMEDILEGERNQRNLKEQIGLQTKQYAALSSRDRISRICESRLGMLSANSEQLVRVSVDWKWSLGTLGNEPAADSVDLPSVMGKDIHEITEVMRQ